MTHRFAVVYEAPADFLTATELANRVLLEAITWLDEDLLPHQVKWIDSVGSDRLTWASLPQLAREKGIKAHGHINGEPLEADAGAARRAILYLMDTFDDLAGIVLIRDQDDDPERRKGLRQARDAHQHPPPVVIGLAIPEREVWVIAGFEPRDDAERARLSQEVETVKFDPCQQSHKLTAGKDDNAPRSPKRVLPALCGGNFDRERECWLTTSLSVLRSRGNENGLAEYLDEVNTRLAPVLGYVPGGSK